MRCSKCSRRVDLYQAVPGMGYGDPPGVKSRIYGLLFVMQMIIYGAIILRPSVSWVIVTIIVVVLLGFAVSVVDGLQDSIRVYTELGAGRCQNCGHVNTIKWYSA